MAADDLFTGSIPEIYDRYLVPLISEPYARDLAERLKKVAPDDVLEIAAGTGVLTRAIASQLSQAPIVATDLNQPMLDHAATRQSDGDRPTLSRCRSRTQASTPPRASSVRCSSPTRSGPTEKHTAS